MPINLIRIEKGHYFLMKRYTQFNGPIIRMPLTDIILEAWPLINQVCFKCLAILLFIKMPKKIMPIYLKNNYWEFKIVKGINLMFMEIIGQLIAY